MMPFRKVFQAIRIDTDSYFGLICFLLGIYMRKIMIAAVIMISLLAIVTPLFVTCSLIEVYKEKIYDKNITQETLGQFGDYFGGLLNPLVSYCGLVVIVLTLLVSFMSLKNAIKDSTSTQARHIEELSQSNAMNLLQIFKDTIDRTRRLNNSDSDLSNPLRDLLRQSADLDIQSLTEEDKNNILRYIHQINIQWGVSSRYLSLLSALNINANPFQKIIFDGAIAFLESDELENILCCLATIKPDLANNIADRNIKIINDNLKNTIEIIAKTSNSR